SETTAITANKRDKNRAEKVVINLPVSVRFLPKVSTYISDNNSAAKHDITATTAFIAIDKRLEKTPIN
ncbi:MAG: hypothetical protein J6N93_07420, partial [Clostridia bacterium]|nr:hypothetical protein [Clostridia bacterium]